ncbi:hypothetical protein [Faecalicatena contorta]|uniref:hypothetical protein n=1 Tax=Faecalicatena contorta TaxID=39482 RepID=UPI001F324B12|nr:hypothetical protein [Faecalicatena contorta]
MKKIMKKIMKKRVFAGSMAAVMTAAMTGTCICQNSLNVKAGDKKEDVEELKETAQKVLGDSMASDSGEVYKDESVYVKADTSGNVNSTTVTEWLKNPGKGTFADTSELKDIKNIKGEEVFQESGSGLLTWEADGKDIYYQGTTEKEMPVEVKISYKLDGKEIEPEDLQGKDGKVEITFDYENNSKQLADVNGEQEEMYTPFTMVTALMLPTDEYQNVTIDHGKIISDADKNIVVGIAFPGLEENLKLEGTDFEIPDSVTITADVENASVGPTITVASSEILDQFDFSDVKDFDGLEDSVEELENAADQLVDGSRDASDGSRALSDGSGTLVDGTEALADGIYTLNEKSGSLIGGVSALANGVSAYTDGVGTLAQGSQELKAGADALKAGAAGAQEGIKAAKAGTDQLAAGYTDEESGAVAGANALCAGVEQLSDSLGNASSIGLTEEQKAMITGMAAQMAQTAADAMPEEAFPSAEAKQMYVSNLSAGYANVLMQQFTNTMNTTADVVKQQIKSNVDAQLLPGAQRLCAGIGTLSEGTLALQQGLNQLYAGSDALVQGTDSLCQGTAALQQGAEQLDQNSESLRSGSAALKEGSMQLVGGVQKLSSGASQVASGAGELSDGAGALAEGNLALAEGMAEFKTSGIDQLTDIFHGDIQNVTARLEAMTKLGQDYRSFAGIRDGMKGSTRFIIETEGLDK